MKRGLVYVISGLLLFGGVTTVAQSSSLRICNNETCLRTSEYVRPDQYNGQPLLIDKLHGQTIEETPQQKEERYIQYIGLIITIMVPVVGFFWWIINSQQEKKMF